MSLMTYEEVRPWARAIKTRRAAREMPPWHIDRNIGITKFKDDPSLSDDEIATIAKWVDSGAPMGNPADMPPPRQFGDLDQWFIGKPDIVISDVGQAVHPPAAGPDNIVDMLRRLRGQGRHRTSGHREQAGDPGASRSCTTSRRTWSKIATA